MENSAERIAELESALRHVLDWYESGFNDNTLDAERAAVDEARKVLAKQAKAE